MPYGYYRSITIDHTKCGSSDSSSFPVLVSISDTTLKTVANGGHVQHTCTQSAPAVTMPADLIFATTSVGSTMLPWEVEFYDAVNGILIAWVQLPTVSHTANTVFYVLYGNSGITTAQNTGSYTPQNVWDGNFKGVWHLSESSNPYKDSTSNGNNSTGGTYPTQTTGQFGNGQLFNGSSNFIAFNNVWPTSGNWTVEAWEKVTALGIGNALILSSRGAPNYSNQQLGVTTSSNYNQPTLLGLTAGDTSPINVFYHIVGTYNGTYITLYQNGIQVAQTLFTPAQVSQTNWIGQDGFGNLFKGILQEVRVSGSLRSADWILTEYNNQNAPGNIGAGNFLTYSAESAIITTQVYTYIANNLYWDGSHWMCDDTSKAGSVILLSATGLTLYTCGPASNPQTLTTGPALSTTDVNIPGAFRIGGATVIAPTELANTALMGPVSGGAALPSFRALTAADVPSINATQVNGASIPSSAPLLQTNLSGQLISRTDGVTGVVAIPKLTTLGSNGSIAFLNGVVTAYVNPT